MMTPSVRTCQQQKAPTLNTAITTTLPFARQPLLYTLFVFGGEGVTNIYPFGVIIKSLRQVQHRYQFDTSPRGPNASISLPAALISTPKV